MGASNTKENGNIVSITAMGNYTTIMARLDILAYSILETHMSEDGKKTLAPMERV